MSVHAYSPPLTSMTFYDLEEGKLVPFAALDTNDPETPSPARSVSSRPVGASPSVGPGRLAPGRPLGSSRPTSAADLALHRGRCGVTAVATRFRSVDDLLADARSRLVRVTPEQAFAQVAAGARIVDIRPAWQREVDGEVPGSLVVERNHLEWRLHPGSDARVPQAAEGQRWLVLCQEGYTSSLAADALLSIGVPATDIIGGIRAWRAAGLPIVATVTRPNTLVH